MSSLQQKAEKAGLNPVGRDSYSQTVQERAEKAGLKPIGSKSYSQIVQERARKVGLEPINGGLKVELDTFQMHGKAPPSEVWNEAVSSIDPFMKLPTGEEARKAIHKTPQAALEVSDLLITGFASFFPYIGKRMSRMMQGALLGESYEEAKAEAVKEASNIAEAVGTVLHLGFETPPKETQAAKSLEKIFISLKEDVFDPLGKGLSTATGGGKYGAALSSDAIEILSFVWLFPKVMGKAKSAKVKQYAKEARGKRKLRETEQALKDIKEEPVKEAPKDYKPAGYEGYSIEEVFGEKASRETNLGDAERVSQREHAARQKFYEDLFTDENMASFFDEVDAYMRSATEPVGADTIQLLFENWRQRQLSADPALRGAFEHWKATRHEMNTKGLYPSELLGQFLEEAKQTPKDFYGEPIDLKFGTERPGPKEYAGPSTKETVEKVQRGEFRETPGGAEPVIPEGTEVRETAVDEASLQGDALLDLSTEIQEKLPPAEKQKLLEAPEEPKLLEAPKEQSAGDMVVRQEKAKAQDQVVEEVMREEKPRPVREEPTREKSKEERFQELAESQRGAPEKAMNEVQNVSKGGLLSYVTEHAGDLTHRMAQRISSLKGNFDSVKEKVNKLDEVLNQQYGFEREVAENLQNNAKYRNILEQELKEQMDQALNRYADEHAKLDVHNKAQQLAKDLAISIGRQRFSKSREILSELKSHVDKGREHWEDFASKDTYREKPVKESREEPTMEDLAEIEAESARAEDPGAEISAERLRHEAAKEYDEFMNDDFDISYESNFHESLMEDNPRPVDEMLRDFKDLSSDLFRDESGHVSMEKLTGEQRARVNRVLKDLQIIQRNAARAGQRIADYLVENGILERDAAEVVEGKTKEILKDKPFETEVKATKGSTEKVDKAFDKAEQAKRERTKKSIKDYVSKLQRGFTARDIEVRKVLENDPLPQAERALLRKVNAAGAFPRASKYFEKAREKIYSHLTHNEVSSLDRLIASLNELEIAKRQPEYKHFGRLKAGELKEYVENFQEVRGLSDASMEKVSQAARDYFDTFHDLRRMKFEEGAIPSWLNDLLSQYDYSPSRWLEILDMWNYAIERSPQDLNMGRRPPMDFAEFEQRVSSKVDLPEKGGNFGPSDPGIFRLKDGSEGYKELNSQDLLASAMAETHSWVMRNSASRSLGKYARLKGHKGDPVRMAPIKKFKVDAGGQKYAVYKKPKRGWKEIHYYQQGTRRTLHARDWFANQWKNSNADIRQQYGGLIRTLSGSGILREFATGSANPTFFIKGFPMDILHVYMAAMRRGKDGKYTSMYSTNLPKFGAQIASDIKDVVLDVIFDEGAFKDYIEEGGLFNFLTETGDVRPIARGRVRHDLNTIRDWLSYMNRTSEALVRVAVRRRAIKEGYESWEATGLARDYLDYHQGGHIAKLGDDAIPYTNVGVQATRGLGKSFLKNPKEFAGKAAWLMGTAAAIYAYNQMFHKEAIDQESQHNKNNYFIFGTGWSITDDRGNKHYVNFKVRKDPSQAALATMSELMMSAAHGDKPEFKRLLMSVKESIPYLQTIPLPPALNSILSYATNTDMLTLEKVWHGEEAGVDEWYRNRTSKLWKDLGEAVNASPEKFKAAAESVITKDSYPAKITGAVYDKIFRDLPKAEQETIVARFLLDNWASDAISLTYERSKYREEFEDIDLKENRKRVSQNRLIDSLSKAYYKDGSIGYDRIGEFLNKIGREFGREDRERLEKRIDNYVETMHLEDQSMWMGIGGSSTPRAKAEKLAKWWKESDEEKREKIQKNLMLLKNSKSRIIPNDMKSRFWKHYYKFLYGDKN